MADIAVNCTDDVLATVRGVSDFGKGKDSKVFFVYSEEDLLSINKGGLLSYPLAGVMYEGIRANGNDNIGNGRVTDLFVTVAVIFDSGKLGSTELEIKNQAAMVLDTLRRGMTGRVSPTKRPWRFISEVPAGTIGANRVVYLQRWATQVMLP